MVKKLKVINKQPFGSDVRFAVVKPTV